MRSFDEFLVVWDRLSTPAFWASDDGREFVEVLRVEFAAKIAVAVCRKARWQVITPDEVVNIAVAAFLDPVQPWGKIPAMQNPAGYLWQCILHAAFETVGTFADHAKEGHEFVSGTVVDIPDIGAAALLVGTPGNDVAWLSTSSTNDMTPLGQACRSSVNVLRPVCPVSLHERLRTVIDWFALNPPTHRGHGHTDAATCLDTEQLGLTQKQSMAFAKICWGTRLREAETSILAWFLLHPDDSPIASPSHRAAIRQFGHEMALTQRTVRRRKSLTGRHDPSTPNSLPTTMLGEVL